MQKSRAILLIACVLILLAALSTALTGTGSLAAPEGPAAPFSIPWWTVDGGGGTSLGGGFALSGSIGQPDAGSLSGGGYNLTGGFWSPEDEPTPTNTPIPTATNTPAPTNTPVPTATNTPAPTDTENFTFLPLITR